jgi:hypothetical protein
VSRGATDAETILISNFLRAPLLAEENPPPCMMKNPSFTISQSQPKPDMA